MGYKEVERRGEEGEGGRFERGGEGDVRGGGRDTRPRCEKIEGRKRRGEESRGEVSGEGKKEGRGG